MRPFREFAQPESINDDELGRTVDSEYLGRLPGCGKVAHARGDLPVDHDVEVGEGYRTLTVILFCR